MARTENESQLALKKKEQAAALFLTENLLAFAKNRLDKIQRSIRPFVTDKPQLSDEEKMLEKVKEEYVIEAIRLESQQMDQSDPVDEVEETQSELGKELVNDLSTSQDSGIDISADDDADELTELIERIQTLSSSSRSTLSTQTDEDLSSDPDLESGTYEDLMMRFETLRRPKEEVEDQSDELTWHEILSHHPQVFSALLSQLSALLKLRANPELEGVRDPVIRIAEYKIENTVTRFFNKKLDKQEAIKSLKAVIKELEQHQEALKAQSPEQKPPVAHHWKDKLRHPIAAIKEVVNPGQHLKQTKVPRA